MFKCKLCAEIAIDVKHKLCKKHFFEKYNKKIMKDVNVEKEGVSAEEKDQENMEILKWWGS